MPICSIEVLNQIRKYLSETTELTADQIDAQVKAFQKTIENEESVKAVTDFLSETLFTADDQKKLGELVTKFRRAKNIDAIADSDIETFFLLVGKLQANRDNKLVPAQKLKFSERTELKEQLKKLKEKFRRDNKTKELEFVTNLLKRVERAETNNKNIGKYIRRTGVRSQRAKMGAIFEALRLLPEVEILNDPDLLKLKEEKFKLIGRLKAVTDVGEKQALKKDIQELTEKIKDKTKELFGSKLIRKLKKDTSDFSLSLLEELKSLQADQEAQSTFLVNSIQDILNTTDIKDTSRAAFLIAKQNIEVIKTLKDLLNLIRKEAKGEVNYATLLAVLGDITPDLQNIINKSLSKKRLKYLTGSTTLTDSEIEKIFSKIQRLGLDQALSNGKSILELSSQEELKLEEELAKSKMGSGLNIDDVDNNTVFDREASNQEVSLDNLNSREQRAKEFIEKTSFKDLFIQLKAALERLERLKALPQFSEVISADVVRALFGNNIGGINPNIFFADAIQEERTITRDTSVTNPSETLPEPLVSAFDILNFDRETLDALPDFKDEFNGDWSKLISFDLEIDRKTGKIYMATIEHSQVPNIDPRLQKLAEQSTRGTIGSFKEFTKDDVKEIIDVLEAMQNQGWKVVGFNLLGADFVWLSEYLDETDLDYSLKLGRIALRSFDLMTSIEVTQNTKLNLNNLSQAVLGRGKGTLRTGETTKVTGTNVVEQLLNATTQAELDNLNIYARGDAQLVIDIIGKIRAKEGTTLNVDVRSEGRTSAAITLNSPVQTWILSGQHGNNGFNFSALFSGFNNPGLIRTATTTLSGFSRGQAETSSVKFNTNKVEQQLTLALVLALQADADTTNLAEAITEASKRATKQELEVLVNRVKFLRRQKEAGVKAKVDIMNDGSETPRFILNISEGVPTYLDTSLEYETEVINAFKAFFLDIKGDFQSEKTMETKAIQKIQEFTNNEFREINANESFNSYITSFINEYILPRVGATSIANFGDGSVDYSPAFNVGYAIAQLVLGRKDGSINKLVIDDLERGNTPTSVVAEIREKADQVTESLKYQIPTRDSISMFSPISIRQLEETYNDWRLKQRVEHILNPDRYAGLTEDQIRERLKQLSVGEYASRVEVLSRSVTSIIPQVTPSINNRRLFNQLPTMDETIERTLEALLDLPVVGAAVVHDSFFFETEIVTDINSDKPLKFKENRASPGAWSAAALINGQLLAQLAWYQTYGLTNQAIDTSIENTVKLEQEGKLARRKIDYFDFDFNGVHHMLMLALAYEAGTSKQAPAKLLEKLQYDAWFKSTSDSKADSDFYNQVAEKTFDSVKARFEKLSAKKEAITASGRKLDANEEQELRSLTKWNNLLSTHITDLRAFFKVAVLPRLYEGGNPSIGQAIFDKLKDLEIGQDITNGDINFLLEKANLSGVTGLISLIDSTIGIDTPLRNDLKNRLASWYNQLYMDKDGKHRFHETLKALATSNPNFAAGIIDLDNVNELIRTRIDIAARMLTKPIDETQLNVPLEDRIRENKRRLYEKWAKKINDGRAFIRSKGGRLATLKDKMEFYTLMGMEPEAYKENAVLVAINALNRTPLKLREQIVNEAWNRFDTPVSEYLGNTGNYAFFQAVSRDLAGGRLYTEFTPISYQGPEYSQVQTPRAMESGDVSESGMYDIDKYRFLDLANSQGEDAARRYILQLVLQNFELRLANEYMASDYDAKASETVTSFMETWKQSSKLERVALERKKRREKELKDLARQTAEELAGFPDLTTSEGTLAFEDARNKIEAAKKELEARKKRGLLVEQSQRFLGSYNNTVNNPSESFNEESTLKGVFAFRPKMARFDITDLPIYSLAELSLKTRIDRQNAAWVKEVKKRKEKPTSIADIIPEKALGWRHTVNPNKLPYINRIPVPISLLSGAIDEQSKLVFEKAKLQSKLTKFAVDNGFEHLIQPGNEDWASLQYIFLSYRKASYRLTRKFRQLPSYDTNPIKFIEDFNSSMSGYLGSIFDLIEFQHNTTGKPLTQLDFSYYGGFNPRMLKGRKVGGKMFMSYFDLLRVISKNSKQLEPLEFGLVVSPRTRVAGDDTTYAKDTRRLPITVQAHDAVNLIFLIFNLEKIKPVITEFAVNNGFIGDVESGPDGFVIPESIPVSRMMDVMNYVRQHPTFKNVDLSTAGFYLNYTAYNNSSTLEIATVDTKIKPGQNLHTALGDQNQLYVTDGNTKYAFTPDMLDQLLLALRNSVVFQQAELAVQTNRSIGERKSRLELAKLKETLEYYNGNRDLAADEATILDELHKESNVPFYSIDAGLYDSRYGVNYAITDSIKYLVETPIALIPSLGKESVQLKAYEMGLLMVLKRAINKAEQRGQRKSLKKFNTLLKNNPAFRDLVPVLKYVIENPTVDRNTVKALISNVFRREDMSTAKLDIYTDQLLEIKQEYLTIVNPPKNTLYYEAKSYLQRLDATTEAVETASNNYLADFMLSRGIPMSKQEEARVAFAEALEYHKVKGLFDLSGYEAKAEDTLESFASEVSFVTRFGREGERINSQIKQLDLDSVSEELYRSFMGFILTRHPELASNITISLDTNLSRLAKMRIVGGQIQIIFKKNPEKAASVLKNQPIEKIVETFSHELSHISVEIAKQRNPIAYEEAIETLRSDRGKEVIGLLVQQAFQGSSIVQPDIDLMVSHYENNPEEALVFWGSFLLTQKVLGDKANPKALKSIYNYSESRKITGWFKRTFSAIADFVESVSTFFNEISRTPKYNKPVEKLNKVFEQFFELTAEPKTELLTNLNDTDLDNYIIYDASTYHPMTEEEFQTMSEYAELTQRLNEVEVNSEEYARIQARLVAIRDLYINRQDSLGVEDFQYYSVLETLRRRGQSLGLPGVEFAQPETPEEELIVVDHIIRKLSDFRGKRVDSRGTAAYLARRIATLLTGSSMQDDSARVNERIQEMQYIVSSIFFGLGSNQSELTYNSPIGMIASLANLLDADSQTTEAYFETNTGLNGIRQNMYKTKLFVRAVATARNELIKEFSSVVNGLDKANSMVVEAFNFLVNGTIDNKFSEEEKKAIESFAKVYKKSAEQLHILFTESGLKDARRSFNPSFLAFKLDAEQFQGNTAEIKQRQRNFKNALKKVIRHKLTNELVTNDFIHPVVFFMSDALPAITTLESTKVDHNQPFLAFIEKNINGTTNENSLEGIMFKVILNYAAGMDRTSTDMASKILALKSRLSATSLTSGEGKIAAGVLLQGYKELLRNASATGTTLTSLLQRYNSNISADNVNAIRNNIIESLRSDGIGKPGYASKIQIMNSRLSPIRIKSEKSILDMENRSLTDYLAQDFINTMGNSSAIVYEDGINPTINDVFTSSVLTPAEQEIVRAGFSRDLSSIISSLEKGLGQQAVSQSLIYELTGIRGMDFLKLVNILESIVTQGERPNGQAFYYQFSVDPTTGERRQVQLTQKQVNLLKNALKALKHKYMYMWNIKQTLDNSQSSMVEPTIGIFRTAAETVWGTNQVAAGLLIDSTMGALGTAMASPLMSGDVLKYYGNYFRFMASMGLKTATDAWRFTQLRGDFADFAEIIWDSNNTYVATWRDLYGSTDSSKTAKNLGKRVLSIFQTLNMTTSVAAKAASGRMATTTLFNQLLTNNLEEIQTILVDESFDTGNLDGYYRLVERLKEMGVRNLPSAEAITRMKAAGIFETGNIAALKFLVNNFNLKKLSTSELTQAVLSLPVDWGLAVGSVSLDRDMLFRAVGSIDKFIDQYIRLGMVSSTAMDAINDDHPLSKLYSLWRSYGVLFGSQVMLRNSSRIGLHKTVLLLLTQTMLDIMYQTFLAIASGFLSGDELERLLKGQPSKKTMLMILNMATRNPMFTLSGNTILEVAQFIGKNVAGEKAQPLNLLSPLGLTAFTQILKSLSINTNKLVNADSGTEAAEAVWMGGLQYLAPGVRSIVNTAINQSKPVNNAISQRTSKPKTTLSNGKPVASPIESAVGYYFDYSNPGTMNNILDAQLKELFGSYYTDMINKQIENLNRLPKIKENNPIVTLPPNEVTQQVVQPVPPAKKTKEPSLEKQATTPIKAPDSLR